MENIHTHAVFSIASLQLVYPGMFHLQNYLVHNFLPLTVLISLSLVNTERQNHDCLHGEVVGMTLSLPKNFSFTIIRHSEYVSTYNSHKLSNFITHKAMNSTKGS
jgi:hypothetical protein